MTSDCATKIKRSKQNSVCEGVPDRSGCNTWLKMGEGQRVGGVGEAGKEARVPKQGKRK